MSTFSLLAQRSSALETNSGPLSERSIFGVPCALISCDSASMTWPVNRSSHVDGKTLAGEFVDEGQALDLLAVGARIEDEIVGPDPPDVRRHPGTGPTASDAFAASLSRHLQTGLAPQPAKPTLIGCP